METELRNVAAPTTERIRQNVRETGPESFIRVLLLIENRLLREALGRIFRKRAEFLLVGSHGCQESSLEKISETECDVIVLDFLDARWLPINLRNKPSNCPEPKFLLIGLSHNPEQFLDAVRGGVTGFLLKDASVCDVVSAVRSTFAGAAVCPAELCGYLFQHIHRGAKDATSRPTTKRPELTLRQQHLVGLVARGLTNKEIAAQLNISEYTVKNHVRRIMKQVDAESRSQAVEAIRSHGYELNPYEGVVLE
jgi:DNA-binding NarL/FixJ family response regulator